MLFWLFVILLVVGVTIVKITDEHICNETLFGLGAMLTVISSLCVSISVCILMFSHIGIDAKVERYNARHESLTYQYENNIYDNDNDLGKRELMKDIQDWNEDLSYRKEIQDDFWLGIYYPNIYDQFEKIELK